MGGGGSLEGENKREMEAEEDARGDEKRRI